MSGFFLRPIDLSALSLLFIAILILWRLLQLRPSSAASRWLATFFGVIILLGLLWLLVGTRLDGWVPYILHFWGAIWSLGIASLIQYTYRIGDLDPKGREARRALLVSLVGMAVVIGWAVYRIVLRIQGQPTANILPIDALNLLGFVWALVVVGRQAHARWRAAQTRQVLGHFVLPFAGIFLLAAAGVSGVAAQLSGNPWVLDFSRVYLAAIGINFIGINYLIYHDSTNARVHRVMGAAMLVLQTAFSFLGVLYTLQFQVNGGTVLSSAGAGFASSAAQLLHRHQLDEWTRPIFLFQAGMSLLALLLMPFAGRRMRVFDPYLYNLGLSDQQQQIITMVAQGLTNDEIANRLLISKNTVRYHLRFIYKTLDLPNRRALILWVRQKQANEPTIP